MYIGNWSNPNDIAVWSFSLTGPGIYDVRIDGKTASDKAIGQQVRISAGEEKIVGKITADGVVFQQPLKLAAGNVAVRVELVNADRTGPAILDLFGVKLTPRK
jgi:hypothetical protein